MDDVQPETPELKPELKPQSTAPATLSTDAAAPEPIASAKAAPEPVAPEKVAPETVAPEKAGLDVARAAEALKEKLKSGSSAADSANVRDAAKHDGSPSRADQREGRPKGQGRENRPPREAKASGPDNRGGDQKRGDRPPRPERGAGDRHSGDRQGGPREGRPGGGRPFELAPDIELEKLIADSLYLDNQAHAVVARMRDMDSGTKSQLRRLYNAVRRAVRAPEGERQHEFVMLRARLAYTIARHSLRSLDALERLLLQVTRRNDARGYERFKDLFEAIVAYNE